MPGKQATGRPQEQVPLLGRLGLLVLLVVAFCEASLRFLASGDLARTPAFARLFVAVSPLIRGYAVVRAFAVAHPVTFTVLSLLALALLLVAARAWLIFWHNQIKARLSGTHFAAEESGFPTAAFDLLGHIAKRPKGTSFVGMQPKRSVFGWRWRPVYITQRQKTMHRHVLGKTGSGKTQSILWPAVLQDLLDGKGALVMDAKGSDENIATMKALAALAKREQQLKVFALPAWNQPQLFTHTYNMVFVRPRTPSDPGGDPVATAERVFSILPLGDNEYYNTQAQIMFVNLCKLLHGIVDDTGHGVPFVMLDLAVCLKAIGAEEGPWRAAFDYCLANSLNQDAAREIESQLTRLGRDAQKCFSGITGAVDKFLSPIVNSYDPDIIFEDVLQKNGIVYVQLPANLFKIQAPAMGKVMLMDVQQEGSLRQVFRSSRNQTPFSVTVDEFYNFADITIVDSLNKLRDANLEYTLAHQSIADLELVSKEFAVAVWDNTRTKDILNQDNPELCEKVAKSLGTHQVLERTVRRQQGALFTSLVTGDASTKMVETYRLHPNSIKGLARCGQGFLYNDEGLRPVAYSMLPPLAARYDLARKPQSNVRGLKLFDTFIGSRTAARS